ncbi:MAG: BamA/TamA family outer membrane protein [Firmicutes bacterium]|jgi:outer membrane protein insertion porin family|nr:BamA/TamA family outer membrane protein [Bacillota bacterium]NLL87946.1 BamA/TamA family outer membrane protein [Bacillota bacterium]HKM17728.1 BamA/TamA family outer membrane protein [Limnochordia bacterium]
MTFHKQRKTHFAVILCLAVLLFAYVQPTSAQRLQNVPIIRAIAIRGNVLIDTAVIEQAITKTRVNDPFVERNIYDDRQAIYDLGYFYNVEVRIEKIVENDRILDNELRVIFQVTEFPVVSEVVIKGAQGLPIDEFVRQMKVKPGEVFNLQSLDEDLIEFSSWASDQHGRPHMAVNLEISETGVVTFEVAPIRIADVIIKGNDKTKDHVISRELTVVPGDYLDVVQVSKDRLKLLNLGFFEDIIVEFEETGEPGAINVSIEVKEMSTGSADFGVGYSSKGGLFGYVDISESNLFGNGQRANAFFEVGTGTRSYSLGFYEPYLLDDGTSIGIKLYSENETKGEDEPAIGIEHVLGGSISLGRPLGEYTRGDISLRTDSYRYSGELEEWEDPYRLLTFGAGVRTNTTNHPFEPSQGYRTDLKLETGFRFGDEDTSRYTKLTMEHSRYYELFREDVVLAIRGYGGRALSGVLPKAELYRIGGSESLRGHDGEQGLVGDKVLLVNTELRFPIWDFISGVAFVDIGKAWQPDEPIDLMEMLNSNGFGIGLRVNTPFGLLRFDYGWGKNEESELEGHFYFGLGHTF